MRISLSTLPPGSPLAAKIAAALDRDQAESPRRAAYLAAGDDVSSSFTAARLFEKTSAKGNMYITGRMGSVRVTVMKSRETAEDGSPIWEMKFAEAAPYKPRDADPSGGTGETRDTRFAERSSAASPSTRASSGNRAAKANYAAPPRSVTDPPLSAGGVPAEYMEIPF